MNVEDLTEEQKTKIKEAKTAEEILVHHAKEEGVELSSDELDGASGGDKEWTKCHKDTVTGPY